MTKITGQALKFTKELIKCRSVTPVEGGALSFIEKKLAEQKFFIKRLPFRDKETPDIDNLFARYGTSGPHLMFAGHTDVVPPGDELAWNHPPFAAVVDDGLLYGRGAADMKGSIGAFMAASLRFIQNHPKAGSISFLITGDEEGPAINGTVKMINWLKENDQIPDHCLVGEPTCSDKMGDAIKIGRRGSINCWLTVKGKQGHVAYPHLARNPVDGLARSIISLRADRLDDGTEHFSPSTLEFTQMSTNSSAVNVIPEEAGCHFNIRFNDAQSEKSIEAFIKKRVERALEGLKLDYDLRLEKSGDAFITKPDQWVTHLSQAIKTVTGQTPALSTSGGTSDARFIKDICPVVEFGPLNATIHQVNEHVPLKHLAQLEEIYFQFLKNYFKV